MIPVKRHRQLWGRSCMPGIPLRNLRAPHRATKTTKQRKGPPTARLHHPAQLQPKARRESSLRYFVNF